MLSIMMLLAAAQIYTSEVGTPQTRLVFVQSPEANTPVPLCEADGITCQCPAGYTLMQQQSDKTVGALNLTCAPAAPSNTIKSRASDTDYSKVPAPSTYGK